MLRRYIALMRNSTLGQTGDRPPFPSPKDCVAEIPPMLFLPLIENAFKHGAARMPEGCRIRIHMCLTSHNELIFKIRNDCPFETPSLMEQAQLQGEGLKLVRNQIEHWKNTSWKSRTNLPKNITKSSSCCNSDSTMSEALTCLIVDNDPYDRGKLVQCLANFQARPLRLAVTCANGKEAFNFLRETDVDILFLDLEMPVMDGPSLLLMVL